jgi:hypothetical protein
MYDKGQYWVPIVKNIIHGSLYEILLAGQVSESAFLFKQDSVSRRRRELPDAIRAFRLLWRARYESLGSVDFFCSSRGAAVVA